MIVAILNGMRPKVEDLQTSWEALQDAWAKKDKNKYDQCLQALDAAIHAYDSARTHAKLHSNSGKAGAKSKAKAKSKPSQAA